MAMNERSSSVGSKIHLRLISFIALSRHAVTQTRFANLILVNQRLD